LVNECGSIALSDEFQLSHGAAVGLSGAPLCRRDNGRICGVVFGARPEDARVYATELCHLDAVWPAFHQDTGSGSSRRNWLIAAAGGASAVAGLLILQPWSVDPVHTSRDKTGPVDELRLRVLRYKTRDPLPAGAKVFTHDTNWEAVAPSTPFRPNEIVRFAVRSPSDGYLYVIDRERYADGTMSTPHLVFPSATMQVDNRVTQGQPLEFPAATDDPPYLRLQQSRAEHIGEVLTLLILSEPLAQTGSMSAEEFRDWSGESAMPPGVTPKVFVHPVGRRARAALSIPVNIEQ
jgi:hypothetical protein